MKSLELDSFLTAFFLGFSSSSDSELEELLLSFLLFFAFLGFSSLSLSLSELELEELEDSFLDFLLFFLGFSSLSLSLSELELEPLFSSSDIISRPNTTSKGRTTEFSISITLS